MKRIALICSIFLIILSSCTDGHDGYAIEGTINGYADQQLILQHLSFEQTTSIDTATTDANGNYELKGHIKGDGYYRLIAGASNWVFLLEEKAHLKINADAADEKMTTLEVTGTPSAEAFQKALDFIVSKQENVAGLIEEYQGLAASMQQGGTDVNVLMAAQQRMQEIQNEVQAKDLEIKEEIKNYISQESDPMTGVYLLSSLDITKDYEFIEKKVTEYKASLPESEYIASFETRLVEAKKIVEQQKVAEAQAAKMAVGGLAPDIVMMNPQGKEYKLSDLKGKVVLIDFWASWCKPCRAENPNVVATYNKYKNKGFTVFSVSLDKARDPWMGAIAQDGLVWEYHVSDLQFWNNAAAKLYGVQSIPAAFLIDQEGKIVGKNLRGPALEAKVKEIVG